MNLYELNKLIAELQLKRDELKPLYRQIDIDLINFYKKKRFELIKTIEQKIKIELNKLSEDNKRTEQLKQFINQIR